MEQYLTVGTHSMTIAIIGAMDEEIKILKSKLENVEELHINNFEYYKGTFAGKDVVLTKSGIGKVNAAIACSLLINNHHPDCIINTGSAGSLHPDLKLGDTVIADKLSYHDVDTLAFGYEFGQVPGMPHFYFSDKSLIEISKQCVLDDGEHKAIVGLITSSDSFIADKSATDAICTHFNEVCAVDMESTAIAQVCHQFNMPFVAVRSISDSADHSANMSFEEFLPIASKSSAQMILKMLEKI